MKAILATLAAAAALIPSFCDAYTTAYITTSGGNGSVMTFTLSSDLTLTTTVAASAQEIGFVFEDFTTNSPSSYLGDLSGNGLYAGGVTYNTAFVTRSGIAYNALEATDLVIEEELYSSIHGAAPLGTTVTLLAGTYTTSAAVSFSVASGTYTVFLIDGACNNLTPTAVPEPASCAAIAAALALGLVGMRKLGKRRAG
jgi:hypothetical protein